MGSIIDAAQTEQECREKLASYWDGYACSKGTDCRRCIQAVEERNIIKADAQALPFFTRQHRLRKLLPEALRAFSQSDVHETATGPRISGGGLMLLGFGGMTMGSTPGSVERSDTSTAGQRLEVTMAWEIEPGRFVVSTFPLSRVRVRFVEDAVPSVSFGINGHASEARSVLEQDQSRWTNEFVSYAEITCREDDWHPSVTLPLAQAK